MKSSIQAYINALQGHQYIPQADQIIMNIIEEKGGRAFTRFSVLDVGCGPARLTYRVAHLPIKNKSLVEGIHITGVDISPSLIENCDKVVLNIEKVFNAKNGDGQRNVNLMCSDFATGRDTWFDSDHIFTFPGNQDVILIQRVMHHIFGGDRTKFFQKSSELLRKDGILIIGDEFVRQYASEEERKLRVANFSLHIIAEAIKGGFSELAYREALKLGDDVFNTEIDAGFAHEEILEYIYDFATKANDTLYKIGSLWGSDIAKPLMEKLQQYCNSISEAESPTRDSYRISIPVFIKEAKYYGFKLSETYKIGPVDQLGGMGVLVFQKR
ncbi:MAG: class I SAM-dependent methyltransferase [Candidatus Pacebacteria bacterium]|nr:class I SAM-dependent methyltransferase [Candidatus Paceibacterota bacterium]